jgi:hypothetical protein
MLDAVFGISFFIKSSKLFDIFDSILFVIRLNLYFVFHDNISIQSPQQNNSHSIFDLIELNEHDSLFSFNLFVISINFFSLFFML